MAKNELIDRDHGWKKLFERAKSLVGETYVKVGVLAQEAAGGLHKKGADGKSKPLTVAEIAAIQEFGTRDGKIPSRSFMRSTFDRMRGQLQRDMEKLAVRVLFGEITPETMFNTLGAKLSAAMKKTITAGPEIPPPNAPSVIARKEGKGTGGAKRGADGRYSRESAGHAVRTLVDTGRMVGAIAWAVVTGKGQGRQKKPKGDGGSGGE